jgi:hypothetical protein
MSSAARRAVIFARGASLAARRVGVARHFPRTAAVARLHCAPPMDEDEHFPILPPPPSTRVVLWAMLNALWFRCIQRGWSRYRGALQAVPRGSGLFAPAPQPAGSMSRLAREGRFTSLIGHLAADRGPRATVRTRPRSRGEDRPTTREARRAPSASVRGA